MIDAFTPNPFATQNTHPANCEFVLPAGSTEFDVHDYLKHLADRFIEFGCLGQIVGPHGCGKSTLAIAMSQSLQNQFSSAATITIRKRDAYGNRNRHGFWPNSTIVDSEPIFQRIEANGLPERALVVLDGCEILTQLNQGLLVHSVQRSNKAFLLTSHRAIRGVTVIASLRPQLHQFLRIVERLQQHSAVQVSIDEITEIWSSCDGNYRIGLRALYDLYSEHVSKAAGIALRAARVGKKHSI